MDPNELLKLLNLNAKPAPTPDGTSPATSTETPASDNATTAGPTALEVDEWGLRRGCDLVAESERLRKAGTDELAAADFFAAGFEPEPKLNTSCVDPHRHQFLAQLLDTPEYH